MNREPTQVVLSALLVSNRVLTNRVLIVVRAEHTIVADRLCYALYVVSVAADALYAVSVGDMPAIHPSISVYTAIHPSLYISLYCHLSIHVQQKGRAAALTKVTGSSSNRHESVCLFLADNLS